MRKLQIYWKFKLTSRVGGGEDEDVLQCLHQVGSNRTDKASQTVLEHKHRTKEQWKHRGDPANITKFKLCLCKASPEDELGLHHQSN